MSRLIEASDNSGYRMEIDHGIASLINPENEMLCEFDFGDFKQDDKWIPCSERLPEVHRVEMEQDEFFMISNPVLITDGKQMCVTQYEYDDEERKGWLDCYDEELEEIIAWMPLPEPYSPDKCHGCFGAANNDCERCADGNKK